MKRISTIVKTILKESGNIATWYEQDYDSDKYAWHSGELDDYADENDFLEDILNARVVGEIRVDMRTNDYTGIDELLRFIPINNRIYFLSNESEWNKYSQLN